jgi:peptide/nickel transport system substrate-binding protein
VKKTILAVVVLLIAACTKSYQPGPDTLVVGLSSQPLTLDPRFATDAVGARVSSLIFNGLVRVGPDFTVIPEAAESWTSKGPNYKFVLRKDLQFHNGRKVLPEDILYTFEFYRGPKSPFASSLKVIKNVSVGEKNGQLVVDLELVREADQFLIGDLPSVKLLPKSEVEAAGDDFNQLLVGTGPFRFVHQKLNEIRLKSVSAKIDNLLFKVIRDDFTRYQKMLKGEVDLIQNDIPSDKVAEFQKRSDRFQVYTYPGLNMAYVLINLREPYLKDLAVRTALAHSIDRDQIIKYKLAGQAAVATSILTPNNPYFNSSVRNPDYDLPAAEKLIAKSGAKGHTFILKTANSPGAIDAGRVLANQMQKAGIEVRHESYEWATYYDDVKKGNFQLATMKWVGTVDPDIYRAAFYSKETPPGRNRGGYNNPDVDRLLDQSQNEGRREARKKIFDQVQMRVHHDVAIIPLWYDLQVAVVKNSVRGYTPVMTSDYWPFTKVFKDR